MFSSIAHLLAIIAIQNNPTSSADQQNYFFARAQESFNYIRSPLSDHSLKFRYDVTSVIEADKSSSDSV